MRSVGIEPGTGWIGRTAAAVTASALAACGGGGTGADGRDPVAQVAAPVRVEGPAVLDPGAGAVWRIDMPQQAPDDPPTGYRITLSEAAAQLDIRTQRCPPPSATGCELWTVAALATALPGRYEIGIEPVGMRSAVLVSAPMARLNFELRRAPLGYGEAVDVAFDGSTLLVVTQDGRLFGRGDNPNGQIGGAYTLTDGFLGADPPGRVQPWQVTAFAPLAATVTAPSFGGGVAIAGGRVWTISPAAGGGTQVLAWGSDFGDGLGLPTDPELRGARVAPAVLPDLGRVTQLAAGGLGVLIGGDVANAEPQQRGLRTAGAAGGFGSTRATLTLDGRTPIESSRSFAGGQWHGVPVLVVQRDGSVGRWTVAGGGAAAPVAGLPGPVQAVSVAGRVGQRSVSPHALALTESGQVWAWPLGTGGDADGTPRRVAGIDDVVQVNAGARAWAVRRDGSLWQWDPFGAAPPARVPGIGHVRRVVDGFAITAACPEGQGALWRIEVDAQGARALREEAFGRRCDGTPTARLLIEVDGGGRVSSVPAGTDCRQPRCDYELGAPALVQLRLVADEGQRVEAVQGDCVREGSSLADYRVELAAGAAATCRVRFAPASVRQLQLAVEGPGHIQWGDSHCPGQCLHQGTATEIALRAVADGGARFVGWAGHCSGESPDLLVDLAGAEFNPLPALQQCTARFEPLPPQQLSGNLLADPGFESTRPAAAGVPAAAGRWQGDASETEVSGNRFGIAPHGGVAMQRFVATGAISSTNTVAGQMWQLVDLRAWADRIDAGGVRADGRAWFNRVVGHAATDRRFDLRLLAFDGAATEVPARYAANTALAQRTVTLDSLALQWQRVDAQLALPVGTRWLLFEIYAFEDVRNDNDPPEFDGHFADDTELVLVRP